MISLIEGLPDDIVGIVATGKVTKKDCDRVFIPAVQKTLSRHDKIRLYYELSSRFPRSSPMSAGSGTRSMRCAS